MGKNNFMNIMDEFSNYKDSKIAILPVAFEKTVTYRKGASKGAGAIIKASKELEYYDEELKLNLVEKFKITTLPEIKAENSEKMINSVYNSVKKIIHDRKFPVVLGGEHSISIGVAKAMKEKYPKLSVLHIDAHADLKDKFENSRYNHTCTARRIHEICDKIVLVGIRSFDEDESDFIKKNKIKMFYARDIYNNNKWFKEVLNSLGNDVYITLDVDALDIRIMPSTTTPEPGGFDYYHLIKFIKYIAQNRNIVGFDVVELSPIKNMEAYDFLAAKLVYKMIGYSLKK